MRVVIRTPKKPPTSAASMREQRESQQRARCVDGEGRSGTTDLPKRSCLRSRARAASGSCPRDEPTCRGCRLSRWPRNAASQQRRTGTARTAASQASLDQSDRATFVFAGKGRRIDVVSACWRDDGLERGVRRRCTHEHEPVQVVAAGGEGQKVSRVTRRRGG